MYFYSGTRRRDCGRNCDEEREFTVYLWSGGQQFFQSTMKRIGNAIDQWVGAFLILYAAIANNGWRNDPWFLVVSGMHYLLEIISDISGSFTLTFFSNTTSLILFAANFPLWCMYAWEIFLYWWSDKSGIHNSIDVEDE